jgi:hypothetical protein
MKLNRKTWPAEDRKDYDRVLRQVIDSSTSSTDRLDLFEKLHNDARQAHRIWANDIDRVALRNFLAEQVRRFQARDRALVSHDGVLLTMPRVQSVRVRTETGESYFQRELIELWSWDQIVDKRAEALRTRGTYTARIAQYDKLLALRDLCPDAGTPAEAAGRLGTTIDGWLAAGADAA